MRIVIDLQAAQSPHTRHRGIGRYAIALAKAMLRQRKGHEILIALNGMFAESVEPLRETFRGLLPQADIRVWHATIPPLPLNQCAPDLRRAAEAIRESFLASLQPDIVHVASMFETSAYSVCGLHGGRSGIRTAVTLYDLIPHIYPDVYLPTAQALAEYNEKLDHVRNADLLLAISDSSRREALEHLHLGSERVVNISGAADEHFTPGSVAPEREAALRERYALPKPFVMYTGGINHRKNIEGLVRAWGRMPEALRAGHQLAVVCSTQPADRERLEALARACTLHADELVLTGYVPEEDLVDLYRLCKLFVFPSQHEGFGLPALEAMQCGAPVIGANNSSIPEVIGRADALFDGHDDASISAMMQRGLQDDAFRASLAAHGLEQARRFSWDRCASIAIEAMEATVRRGAAHAAVDASAPAVDRPSPARPKLALLTPMPPQPSGIADSSADVLPHLATHYEIDLVIDQSEFQAPPQGGFANVRTPQWFEANAHTYDRIVYQFGNSEYHSFEFDLFARHPGVVILHDFFISGIVAHRELHLGRRNEWSRALYASHGWPALVQRFHSAALGEVIHRYPANFPVVGRADGVIVHSRYALRLAHEWFGNAGEWRLVPLLRTPPRALERAAARARLGIAPDAFLVCSFGHLGPIKHNQRLLRGWLMSVLAADARCQLVFVGKWSDDAYGRELREQLAPHATRISVTGWVSAAQYEDYLAAADLAVQLRTLSRGETSAAVLDCMNHGLPAIVNAEGSMADLDTGAVWLLPREFTDAQLADALTQLRAAPQRRAAMSAHGRRIVQEEHSPQACAAGYAEAIEAFAHRRQQGRGGLVDELAATLDPATPGEVVQAISRAVAQNLPAPRPAAQLAVDITGWVRGPMQPATLPPLMLELIHATPAGWRVEPVYEDEAGVWRYARARMLAALNCPDGLLADEPADLQPGDVWAALPAPEWAPPAVPQRAIELGLPRLHLPATGDAPLAWAAIIATAPAAGRRQWFIDVSELVNRDAHTGIQRVVKNHLIELMLNPPRGTRVLPVYATTTEPGYRVAARFAFRLAGAESPDSNDAAIEPHPGDVFFGLDLQPAVVPAQAATLAALKAGGVRIVFMVYDLLPITLSHCFSPGAAEHFSTWLRVVAMADQAICISHATADQLRGWLAGNGLPPLARIDAVHLGANLAHALPTTGRPEDADAQIAAMRSRPTFLMVGTLEPRKGHAAVLAAFERLWSRGVNVGLVISGRAGWLTDDLVQALQSHPERGDRLLWIQGGSDEYLAELYDACACLIAASFGEGFGLPLVEAAQHKLPIVARELPVFREIAGDAAFYFSDDSPDALAARLEEWLALFARGAHPRSDHLPWITWRESAEELKRLLDSPISASQG